MNEKLFRQAEEFARQPYQVHVFADETTDGEPCYVATVPKLSGCISDGDTVEEALKNVQDAKADFIYFLLEDGLEVPQPQLLGNAVRIDLPSYGTGPLVDPNIAPTVRFVYPEPA